METRMAAEIDANDLLRILQLAVVATEGEYAAEDRDICRRFAEFIDASTGGSRVTSEFGENLTARELADAMISLMTLSDGEATQ